MNQRSSIRIVFVLSWFLIAGSSSAHDLVLRGGIVYDGSGRPPVAADVAVVGDRISAIAPPGRLIGLEMLDVDGLAIAPGFINMLSQADETLLADSRSLGDLYQGVTLEVIGEGLSMAPLNDALRERLLQRRGRARYDVNWTTMEEFLDHMERRGMACNLASFVGAGSVRLQVVGNGNRRATEEELRRMQNLVRRSVEEGALGLSSALIYAPGSYADTEELIALARISAESGGIYATHLRSESHRLLEALDELFRIGREGETAVHIHHLKASGESNWPTLDRAVEAIEEARGEGIKVTASMYAYTAAWTGLDAAMPPWVQEGGNRAWLERLDDPEIRSRVASEIETPGGDWENYYLAAGSADRIRLVGFQSSGLRPLTGMTLAAIAERWDMTPPEAIIDLVRKDGSRVGAVYFVMSEKNLRRKLVLPWVGFCSDERSMAAEGAFLKKSAHPRAYGNFARVIGQFVREEHVMTLEEAVRKLTLLPAEILQLKDRGQIEEGAYADLAIFDPAQVHDNATYEEPHQYAEGMVHVIVNGEFAIRSGEPTGARPGRSIRGRGWRGHETGRADKIERMKEGAH